MGNIVEIIIALCVAAGVLVMCMGVKHLCKRYLKSMKRTEKLR